MKVLSQIAVAAAASVVVVASASAASSQPSVAGMTLVPADVPGAKIVSQGSVAKGGYLAAYQRTLKLSTPYGRSLIVEVRSQGMLAQTKTQVGTDLAVVQRILKSKAGRAGFIAGVASAAHVTAAAVKLSALRHPSIGDGTVEQPLSVQLKTIKVYESLLYMRLDRALVELVVVGGRPISQVDSANLTRILQGHVTKQLTPLDVTPPAITGTVDIGQTLTVTPGTWSNNDVTLTYQWQRCDATGANCVAVPGATTATYVVSSDDAGATLNVVETATDRFGAPAATSAVTTAVPVPPPPPPPPSP
jgi:hypothetical protein